MNGPRHPVDHWLVPKRLDFDTMKELLSLLQSEEYFGKKYDGAMQRSLGLEFPKRGRGEKGLSSASIRHLVDSLRFFGFVYVDDDKRIRTTEAGKWYLLEKETRELFQRQLIKWQFPNPGQVNVTGVKIRPFLAIFNLLLELDYLTRTEMYMYLYTIRSPKDILETINKIRKLREGITKKEKDVRNLDRYSVYLTRILATTGLFSVNGRTISILEERKEDVKSILKSQEIEPKPYDSIEDYYDYFGDPEIPELPQEKVLDLRKRVESLIRENKVLKEKLHTLELPSFKEVDDVIDTYKNITNTWKPPLFFEWNTKIAFESIGGFHMVTWNGVVDEAGNPVQIAGGGLPDLIVRSSNFSVVIEVTLRRGVNQWNYEHRSVVEHVEDVSREESSAKREVFGLFIAEKIHPRTINTFWGVVRDQHSVTIVPITKNMFIDILEFHKDVGGLTPSDIRSIIKLFEKQIHETKNPSEWKSKFPELITKWKKSVFEHKLVFQRVIVLHRKVEDFVRKLGNLNAELTESIIWGICKASDLFQQKRELRETLDIMSRFGLLKKNANYTWSPVDDFEINVARLRKSLLLTK